MKLLYFDCMSGISADMAVGAFLDLGIAPETVARELEALHLPVRYDIEAEKTEKNGVAATAFRTYLSAVPVQDYSFAWMQTVVALSELAPNAKRFARKILSCYARALSCVSGEPEETVSLEGKRAMKTLIDVAAASVCICRMDADGVLCSPLTEGSGFAESAHGLMRLPHPTVMELLRDAAAPIEICGERTQLITPCGAAIVCGLAHRFCALPSMTVSRIGFGAGTKDLDSRANVLRVIEGHTDYRFFEEGMFHAEAEPAALPNAFWSSCE